MLFQACTLSAAIVSVGCLNMDNAHAVKIFGYSREQNRQKFYVSRIQIMHKAFMKTKLKIKCKVFSDPSSVICRCYMAEILQT